MKNILILGAGLSASSLIKYLLKHSEENNWKLTIVDRDKAMIDAKVDGNPNGKSMVFNALDSTERRKEMEKADLVISMLPARYHVDVAEDCIALKKHMLTPSYISKEMRELDAKAKEAGICIMNEIGVDPGIDHMSAMKIIHAIQNKGGEVESFKSFCGGLIAPESDNNPWNYKFTWNPRNVVLAGQGPAASFLRNNKYKYIPYNQLFTRLEKYSIEEYGDFIGYANRNSLPYRETYGLENVPTIFRGTLRRPGFCEAWNVFIELGITENHYSLLDSSSLTAKEFINAFLPYHPAFSVEDKFKTLLGEERKHLFSKFEWLGLFDDKKITDKDNATPAQLLQAILEKKLMLDPEDKDMIAMIHQFIYSWNNKRYKITSSMVNIGDDPTYTSMSNTVGYPMGIYTKLLLNGEVHETGVTLPITPELYNPILDELEDLGVVFKEKEEELKENIPA